VLSTSSAETARCSLSLETRANCVLASSACASSAFRSACSTATSSAPLDYLTWFEVDIADRTGQFVANADRTRRDDGADCRGDGTVLALLRDGRLHRFHGLGLIRRGSVGIFQR